MGERVILRKLKPLALKDYETTLNNYMPELENLEEIECILRNIYYKDWIIRKQNMKAD